MSQRHSRAHAAARGEVLYVDGRHIEHVEGGVIVSYYVLCRRKCGTVYEQQVGNRYFITQAAYDAMLRQLRQAAVDASLAEHLYTAAMH